MSKNLKPEYIRKLLKLDVPNGYKFDLGNYLYNPAHGNEYPSFRKVIAETADILTYRTVRYFKYHDGSGDYEEEIYDVKKADQKASSWAICHNVRVNTLEASPRFSLKKLLSFC